MSLRSMTAFGANYRGTNANLSKILRHAVSDESLRIGRMAREPGQAFCDKSIANDDSYSWGDPATIDCPKCLAIVQRETKPKARPAARRFVVGDIVVSSYRVPPFLTDETLRVVELSNVGTKSKPEWRVKCKSDRGVEGWLDGDNLTVVA